MKKLSAIMEKTFLTAIRNYVLMAALIFIGTAATAQITGTVTDTSTGEALIGASVIVQGTTNGTITDIDGNFSLDANQGDVLIVSYVGFEEKAYTVNGTNLDLGMSQGVLVDEIVVTGYTTQTRGDITGSVSSVDVSEAAKLPVTNAAEALQGRVSGVTVINAGTPGQPPRVIIRGIGTSNNSNPLYIIDGLQTDDPFALNNINPDDIEQINVLKDGAAAIYGARASNGVVIITTKGGGYNQDKPTVNLTAYTGFSQITNVPGVLNTQQHADVIFQSQINSNGEADHPQYGNGTSPVIPSQIAQYSRVVSYDPITRAPVGTFSATANQQGTDWIDAITRSALVNNVNLSFANGTESGKYYLSAGFTDRDGVLEYTGFVRANTKVNSEFKFADRFTVGQHLNLSFTNTRPGVGEAIENALRITPLLPVRDDTGEFAGTFNAGGTSNTRNPVAQLFRSRNDFFKRYSAFGDVYLGVDIIDNLTFKTVLAGRLNTFDSRQFTALDPEHGEPLATNTLAEQNQTATNWNWTNTLNYRFETGSHYFNAVAGIEALRDDIKGNRISRTGFLFEVPEFYLLSNGSGAPNVDFAFDSSNTLFSIFGSVNYSFDDKYFATATLRRDESSRFSGDNKSDIFPSFSVGWDLSRESFFPTQGALSRLKLKASWGLLGNQTLPANNPTLNISSLSEGTANYAFNGSTVTTGAVLTQVGNPNLRWETSESLNLGVELGFIGNRLTAGIEYFVIDTRDLITRDFNAISTTAIDAAAPLVNLGDIRNRGVDIELGFSNQTEGGFGYDLSVNVSRYRNEVIRLINGAAVPGRADLRNGSVTRTEEGEPLSFFFGRNVTGLDANGRFEFEEVLDEDGGATDNRQNIGSPHPDFTYGINASFNYGGFDASLFFTGSQGNEIYNYNRIFTDFGVFPNGNRSDRVLDAWTPQNTDTDVPALLFAYPTEEASQNSFFIEDGSFFRLKNAQIGYTLPKSLTERINMSGLRFYVQATNLFTITEYTGFDPEIISNDNLSLGIDFQTFPVSKGYTVGLNVSF